MAEEETPGKDAAPSTQATGTTGLTPNNLFGTPGLSSSVANPTSDAIKDTTKEMGGTTLDAERNEDEEGDDGEDDIMEDEEELTGHMASLAVDSAGAAL